MSDSLIPIKLSNPRNIVSFKSSHDAPPPNASNTEGENSKTARNLFLGAAALTAAVIGGLLIKKSLTNNAINALDKQLNLLAENFKRLHASEHGSASEDIQPIITKLKNGKCKLEFKYSKGDINYNDVIVTDNRGVFDKFIRFSDQGDNKAWTVYDSIDTSNPQTKVIKEWELKLKKDSDNPHIDSPDGDNKSPNTNGTNNTDEVPPKDTPSDKPEPTNEPETASGNPEQASKPQEQPKVETNSGKPEQTSNPENTPKPETASGNSEQISKPQEQPKVETNSGKPEPTSSPENTPKPETASVNPEQASKLQKQPKVETNSDKPEQIGKPAQTTKAGETANEWSEMGLSRWKIEALEETRLWMCTYLDENANLRKILQIPKKYKVEYSKELGQLYIKNKKGRYLTYDRKNGCWSEYSSKAWAEDGPARAKIKNLGFGTIVKFFFDDERHLIKTVKHEGPLCSIYKEGSNELIKFDRVSNALEKCEISEDEIYHFDKLRRQLYNTPANITHAQYSFSDDGDVIDNIERYVAGFPSGSFRKISKYVTISSGGTTERVKIVYEGRDFDIDSKGRLLKKVFVQDPVVNERIKQEAKKAQNKANQEQRQRAFA